MIRNLSAQSSDASLGEDAIKQFESAWQSGTRPEIADFLKSSSNSKELLIELVHIDLEFRYRLQESPRIEEYLKLFPQLLENSDVVVNLIDAEYCLRDRFGPAATQDEFVARFPELREAITGQLAAHGSTLTWPRRRHHRPPALPQIPGYIIEEELGYGGMGVVYRATQPTLQRAVAIKTLLFGVATTVELKNRFRNEAEAIARLNHPHLVPVYEVGEWKPEGTGAAVPYFVMKYYAGGSLANEPAGPGTDLNDHARTVATISHAVHHAHQRGILHRDLKPSNILLDENSDPHVVDFGLAGRFDPNDPKSMTATIIGTPAYMAPEQAHSPSQVTTAADVYGLGAILYHLVTGRAFQAETPLAMLERVAHQEPARPSQLNPRIPRDLETICLKCLEKDPARRYESSAALALDLERYRAGQSIMARPVKSWERAWRTVKRHPIISSLTMLTFVILLSSVALLAINYIRIHEKEQETSDALQRERWAHTELISTFNREQQLLYGKRISSAGRLWASNQLPQAWAELDECPVRFRGWEWRYFNSLRGKEPTSISTPNSATRCVGFLSETQIITGDSEGIVTIWDWQTKSPLKSWKGSSISVRQLAVYPRKKWLAVCDQDNLSVWNYDTQERLAYLPGSVWASFSADGAFLAATHTNDAIDSKDVIVWETGTWSQKWLLTGHKAVVLNGTFSPDSRTLATCSSDRTVRRWNIVDGKEMGEPWARSLPTFRLAYLPDGKVLAEAQPSTVIWVDAESGKEMGSYNWSSVAKPLVLTGRVQVTTGPDPARIVFSGPSHDVQFWDIKRNRSVAVFRGHNLHIGTLELSPEGKRIVSASYDQTIRIWEIDQPIEYRSHGTINPLVFDMALSPDGQYVAAIPNFLSKNAKNDTVNVLSTSDGSVVGQFPGVGAAAFMDDGCLLTSQAEGGLKCWNLKTKEKVWHHDAPQQKCVAMRASPDGNTIAAVQLNGVIKTLDRKTGKKLQEHTFTPKFFGTAGISPQVSRLAFVGQNGVELWDLSSLSKVGEFPMNGTRKFSFSRNGEIVATAEADRVIRLYDATKGTLLLTLPGHPRTVNSLAFSSDGKRLVSSCADGLIRLWDVETGLELTTLPGQFEENVLVSWDHANDQIVAVDTKVHIWQTTKADSAKSVTGASSLPHGNLRR